MFPVRAEGDQTQCIPGERLHRSRSRRGVRCRHATARQKRQVQADRASGSWLWLLNDYKGLFYALSEVLSLHAPLPTQLFQKQRKASYELKAFQDLISSCQFGIVVLHTLEAQKLAAETRTTKVKAELNA